MINHMICPCCGGTIELENDSEGVRDACETRVIAGEIIKNANTDGYPEHSEEWKKCGTVREYCAGEGYSDRVRGHRIEDPLTDLPLMFGGEILTTSEMEAIIKPIGEGTMAEIEYAKRYNIPVKYLEEEN